MFNEAEKLPSVLYYGYPYFDEFIIADGAYAGRAPKPHSKDKTIKIAKMFKVDGPCSMMNKMGVRYLKESFGSYEDALDKFPPKPVKIIMVDSFWPSEVYKRNRMLEEVEEGDWHFYMDGDWKCIWKKAEDTLEIVKSLPDEVDSLIVEVAKPYLAFRKEGRLTIPQVRYPDTMAFRKRRGLHYLYNHTTLADDQGRYVWDIPGWTCEDVGILYEELHRVDQAKRDTSREILWSKSQYVELSNGIARFVCISCKYGVEIKKENGEVAGFLIPRGKRTVCPECGSAFLGNPAFIQAELDGTWQQANRQHRPQM